jgi:hypothetical protein
MASVAIRVDVEPDMTPYAKAPRQLRAVEASSCPVRVNQTESIAPILCGRSPLFPGGFVQDLGRDLYVGSNRLAMTRMDLSINVQRALAEVRSAPVELDLKRLKASQRKLHEFLGSTRDLLQKSGGGDQEIDASLAKIAAGIKVFETASTKVYDFAPRSPSPMPSPPCRTR